MKKIASVFNEMMRANGMARIFALCIAGLCMMSLWGAWNSPLSVSLRKQVPIFALLIGTDWVDHAQHSDTIIFARYDPSSRSLDLLSIPRDTKVSIPKLRVRKINEVYAYAFRKSDKDPDKARQELTKAIEWLIFSSSGAVEGQDQNEFAHLPNIHYYAQLDYGGFKKMIDILGGVPVTVDEPMHYDDNWGKLHIHFDPGNYWLNGQKALEYVRFRGLSGDFGRVLRQQEFMLRILGRFKDPLNILKLPQLIYVSLSSVKTNLSWMDRFLVLLEMRELKRENIRLMQLPGKFQRGLWIPDHEGVVATFGLLKAKETKCDRVVSEVVPEPSANEESSPIDSRTTVEVWNASSKKGLALAAVRRLRSAGFDVVKWGNYSSRQQRTLVRDHKGKDKEAKAIAAALGPSRAEVFTRVDSGALVDVEVILGENYEAEE